ncbi:hypothetical protein HPT27_16215 [Permianibacter sp. IMCC34836]|uniref:DUF6279 family lipoprotein n=1 Tax=Permianibacter fluminis TaxID=2738515 RepID=UPI001552DE23|nr:DUF6279 family lipoprotein [Permianibacter fluminis]NQD38569.1 hypothetical protein [Permianibacter fluminis]
MASISRRGFTLALGRVLAVTLALLLLAGCSLGFVYPRLDTLIGWQLDRYLKLESGQERWLDERLDERLAWHQREQLPRWREALGSLRSDIAERRLDGERYLQYSEQVRSLLSASAAGLVDDAVKLAAGLSDRQIAHLLKRYDEDTDDLVDELAERAADPSERLAERFDDSRDEIENWLGDLTDDQQAYLRQWQTQAIDWGDFALVSRQRWREHIVQTLSNRSDAVALQAGVAQMLLQPESLRAPAYQAAVAKQTELRRDLQLYLLQTLTDKQRQHLLGELDDILEDIDDVLKG